MELFEPKIEELRRQLESARTELHTGTAFNGRPWPRSLNKQMVLEQDMGAELGKAGLQSFSVHLWTESLELVRDGLISVYGQDIPLIAASGGAKSVSFGKIALLGVDSIPSEEVYPSFERLDAIRFTQNLEGYMLRGFTQRNREWSRISRVACAKGFDFAVLGRELIRDYMAVSFVRQAEMFFLTDDALIRTLSPIMEDCNSITHALNTMFENINMDCKKCNSASICDEIDGLRRLHHELGLV